MRLSRISLQFVVVIVAATVLLSACTSAAEDSASESVIAEEAAPDEAAPAEEDSSSSEAEVSETSGIVQEIDQTKIVVNDLSLSLTADTEMAETPQVGDEVAVQYVIDSNGELSAQVIEIVAKASADDGAAAEEEEEIDY